MRKIWWFLITIIAFLLVVAVTNNGDDSETPEPPTTPTETPTTPPTTPTTPTTAPGYEIPTSRSFEMGNLPVPIQPLSTEGWIKTFDSIAESGEVVLIHKHLDWASFVTTPAEEDAQDLLDMNFVTEMSDQRDLELFTVLDYRSSEGHGLDSPATVGTSFADEDVRSAFKNTALAIVKVHNPIYLGLGSEINTYMNNNPDDAENLATLIAETKQAVKEISPNTIVTSTFQFEALTGTFPESNGHWEYFEMVEPNLDMVSITTYPSIKFASPAEMPENYYTQIKSRTNKPIIIAESGWPTAGPANLHGSIEGSDEFLSRLVELNEENDLRLWIYWFIHDWSSPGGYSEFFKTMGLKESDGTPKPAWNTWKEINDLPLG